MNTASGVEFFVASFSGEVQKEISEFMLYYGLMIVFYTTDISARMLSLTHCKRLVNLLNFLDEEEEGKPRSAGKYSFSFCLTTVTSLLITARGAAFLWSVNTNEPQEGESHGLRFYSLQYVVSDIIMGMGFRVVYIYAVTMLMGFRILGCYEDFCSNFKLTCFKSDGKCSKRESAIFLNSKFTEFQNNFASYQDIAGDNVLTLVFGYVFAFVHYIYDEFQAESIVPAVEAWAGIVECLLVLFSLGLLGNTMESKVNGSDQCLSYSN